MGDHRHLGQRRLRVDLLRDFRRGRRSRNGQPLMIVGVGIVVERPLRRLRFRPNLQCRQLVVGRQVIAAAGDHQFLNR